MTGSPGFVRRRLRARPVAAASVVVLGLLYLGMAFAEFLAPYDPNTQFRFHTHHPPALRFYSPELGFGPQVQRRVLVDEVNRRYAPNPRRVFLGKAAGTGTRISVVGADSAARASVRDHGAVSGGGRRR